MTSANFYLPLDEAIDFGEEMRNQDVFPDHAYRTFREYGNLGKKHGDPIITSDLSVWNDSEGEGMWTINVYEQEGPWGNSSGRDLVFGFTGELPESYKIADVISDYEEFIL